jgi:transcriptional regulator with XRE-family HTH domain
LYIDSVWVLAMNFASILVEMRKKHGLTQQALADAVGMHVNQIKKYESGTSQPTLGTLIRIAKLFHVTLDELVFAENDRGPSDDFRLQFEAISAMSKEEKLVAKEVLESLILRHQAKRWTKAS